MQKVIELGNPEEEFVQNAKDLIESLENLVQKSDGVTPDIYMKNHELFDQAVAAMEKEEWEKAAEYLQTTLKLDNPVF